MDCAMAQHGEAQLKGMDLIKWLDNKLGDPNDHWCSRQAVSAWSREILMELSSSFNALDVHVKLKLIQSIPHLSSSRLQTWRGPLNGLLREAQNDPSEWVRTLAELYYEFPAKRCFQACVADPQAHFNQTVDKIADGRKLLINIIPLDCTIANPSTAQMVFGYSSEQPSTHFLVKKDTKAQMLMQEALRSAETQCDPVVHKKVTTTSFNSVIPVKMRNNLRRCDNALPMKGISTGNLSKLSGGFTNEPKKFQRTLSKREGGAMLLDLADLPQPHLKKRRTSMQVKEAKEAKEAEKQAKEAERQEARAAKEREKAERLSAKGMHSLKRISVALEQLRDSKKKDAICKSEETTSKSCKSLVDSCFGSNEAELSPQGFLQDGTQMLAFQNSTMQNTSTSNASTFYINMTNNQFPSSFTQPDFQPYSLSVPTTDAIVHSQQHQESFEQFSPHNEVSDLRSSLLQQYVSQASQVQQVPQSSTPNFSRERLM